MRRGETWEANRLQIGLQSNLFSIQQVHFLETVNKINILQSLGFKKIKNLY